MTRRILTFVLETIAGVILLAGALLYFFHDDLIRKTAEIMITDATGFRVKIESLRHELPAELTLRNVTLYNPPGFESEIFARSPYFFIDIDLPALLKRESFHIRLWKLIITELNVEKNKRGVINGKLLKSIKTIVSRKTRALPAQAGAAAGEDLDFKMDRLVVEIKRVDYVNRTGVTVKKFNKMKLQASIYENVTDFSAMIDVIIDKILSESSFSRYFQMGQYYFSRSVDKAAEALQAPGKMLTEQVKAMSSEVVQEIKHMTEQS